MTEQADKYRQAAEQMNRLADLDEEEEEIVEDDISFIGDDDEEEDK